MNKTPQFDKAINEVLKTLKPHKRPCKQCQEPFEIQEQDIDFYNRMKVPAPALCPRCRMQRRMGYRITALPIFYKRRCDAPGHNEKIISFHSQDNPVRVYDDDFYHGDKWEGLEFARDYDFNRPFFPQFNEFKVTIPHQSLFKDPKSISSDYVVSGVSAKNCFYVAVPYYSENCYYGRLPAYCKDCFDMMDMDYCEQCYEGVFLDRCYNCSFCYESVSCIDSYFLYDCRNCTNCFGCTNLRNKKYYFFNEALTKEEYMEKIKEINLGKRSVLNEYKYKFEKILGSAIRKCVTNIKVENCLGNDLKGCKNCFQCFRILDESENLRYVGLADRIKDMMDFLGGSEDNWCYESTGIAHGNMIKFSYMVRTGIELEYCGECNNCENCFACFGLKNKKFCVFNRQYEQEEYWKIVDEIKTDMLTRGEYGEFFPLKYSAHGYNDSNAIFEFPMTKQEVLNRGWHWQEKEDKIDIAKFNVLEQVPDDIADVEDDILEKVIVCEQTGKPFRIIKSELDFYRRKKLPLPVIHPLQRIRNRLAFRHPYNLWQYPCFKCGNTMHSGYEPERKLKVFCEKCYLKEVI